MKCPKCDGQRSIRNIYRCESCELQHRWPHYHHVCWCGGEWAEPTQEALNGWAFAACRRALTMAEADMEWKSLSCTATAGAIKAARTSMNRAQGREAKR